MSDTPGLAALEQALQRDFARLNHPPTPWIPETLGPDGAPLTDVLIVGGGMCGLAAAFALRRVGVQRICHIDRAKAGREGPWLNYARMNTLRSPKHLTGPAQEIANLSFRAWFEAQHGATAWESLVYPLRTMWMDYLQWFRRVTAADIDNQVALTGLATASDYISVELARADGSLERRHARQVVLATGREGQAKARVPAPLEPFYGGLVQHSSESIDFAALRGRRVAVIGLAASAFDNAATALDAGAATVTLLGRAESLPRLNKMKQTVYPGFSRGFYDLPDREKLKFLRHISASRIAPPRNSVLRVASDPRLRLLLAAEVTAGNEVLNGTALRIDTTVQAIEAEKIILATGFDLDLSAPRELSAIAANILRWRDRLPGDELGEWLDAPYLGAGFEFCERAPNATPGLPRIRCFTHSAQLSLGNLANDIPAVGDGAQRLADAIARSLFLQDHDRHWQNLVNYQEPELLGDEWSNRGDKWR